MLQAERHEGKTPTFVLVHGWTCDHSTMLPVAAAFPEHAAVLPDLPGHGDSPADSDYSIGQQASAVLEIAPETAIWVGHSMGAQIVVEAAALAPSRVVAAVLLDPAAIAPHEGALAFRDRMRRDLADTHDFPALMEKFSRGMIVSATDTAAVDRLAALQRRADRQVAEAGWEAIWSWDGRAALAAVQCPVLVITVDKTMNRPSDLAKLNRRVSTAQVMGSGHMLQYEVMDQVAAMMRRFLTLNGLVSDG